MIVIVVSSSRIDSGVVSALSLTYRSMIGSRLGGTIAVAGSRPLTASWSDWSAAATKLRIGLPTARAGLPRDDRLGGRNDGPGERPHGLDYLGLGELRPNEEAASCDNTRNVTSWNACHLSVLHR